MEGVDRISNLPQEITEKIIMGLPIRDGLRTSILSRKWRYCWGSIPVLVFNDRLLLKGSSLISTFSKKQKLANVIFHVLLLHKGPLMEFSMLIVELEMVSEIDQIILCLSRSNTLKSFKLDYIFGKHYKLPSSFFSLQRLQCLRLSNCHIMELPLNFNGFPKLTSLILISVEITAKMLKRFLTKCPLLQLFYLVGYKKEITRGNEYTFVDFLTCLPSISCLAISLRYMMCFAAGGMPPKLPNSLIHLRLTTLYLGVNLAKQDEISTTLGLINNSPYLVTLFLGLLVRPTNMDSIELQEYQGFKLNNLWKLEIVNFSNSSIELEFLRLILADATVLKKARIELNNNISVSEELMIFGDLMRLPRASTLAQLVIERPRTSP